MKKTFYSIVIIFVLALPSIMPFLRQGFFMTDDAEWMIIRFSAFYSALSDGQFPVRFLHNLNSGYGYPVPTFLYPGFMYFGVPIQILTSNVVTTIKIIFGLSLIGSALFTYFWLSRAFTRFAALIGCSIGLYLPYHLYDVYTRGSLGEVFALMWMPFIFWNIDRKSIFFSATGITLLILSHNTLALLFLPIIIIYMFLKIISIKPRAELLRRYLFVLLTGLGMASFFTIPAVFELDLTRFSSTEISNPLLYFADLNLIGIVSIFVIVFAGIILYCNRYKIDRQKNYVLLFLAISIITLLLSSSFASIIWENIPSAWIQFPFRLLSYLIIAIPFLAAYTYSKTLGVKKILYVLLIIIFVSISAFPYIAPAEYFDKGHDYYATNMSTTTVGDEYMPKWITEIPTQMAEKKVEITKGEGSIHDISYDNKTISFSADIKTRSDIRINTLYWPGWNAFVDDQKINISYNNSKGLIQLPIPSGQHNILLKFEETPLRVTGNVISILSFLILILLVLKISRQKI